MEQIEFSGDPLSGLCARTAAFGIAALGGATMRRVEDDARAWRAAGATYQKDETVAGAAPVQVTRPKGKALAAAAAKDTRISSGGGSIRNHVEDATVALFEPALFCSGDIVAGSLSLLQSSWPKAPPTWRPSRASNAPDPPPADFSQYELVQGLQSILWLVRKPRRDRDELFEQTFTEFLLVRPNENTTCVDDAVRQAHWRAEQRLRNPLGLKTRWWQLSRGVDEVVDALNGAAEGK